MYIKTFFQIEEKIYLKRIDFPTDEYLYFINDYDTCKYLYAGRNRFTKQSLCEFLYSSNMNPPNCVFGLFLNDVHVGNMRLSLYDKLDNTIEIGWLISKENWGKGLASKAGRILLEYCFNDLGIRKVELGVVSINVAACRVYEKLGFKIEGSIRKKFFLEDKYYDVIRMGIFQNEMGKIS